MKNWRTTKLKKLIKAIHNLKKEKDLLRFFRDLCTLDELEEMAERWHIVGLLNLGKSYRHIAKITGASTTTIARIAEWLAYGEGGYKVALKHLHRKKRS